MRLTLGEIEAATGGERNGDADLTVDGATIDSRDLRSGQLFVAMTGDRDGHDFVAHARASGAGAVLAATPVGGGPTVVVADTGAALLRLGAHARDRLGHATVVGVTGSVGKTSVKDLTAAAMHPTRRTFANVRSFNNEMGVPLTLLEAPADAEVGVIEMGARGRGHIELLCGVARPRVGVVTAVALAHTEIFGTLEEVAEAKSELVRELPPFGTAVLNEGDDLVRAMARTTAASVLSYGIDEGEVRATRLALDGELRPRFRLVTPWGEDDLQLAVRGAHNAENAAAAAAAALAAGAGFDGVLEGLAAARLSPWRMELLVASSGARILNDAYNANPSSMEAAFEALVELDAERRTAVLGVMAELGDHAEEQHRQVGDLARAMGIRVISVDAPGYGGEDVPDLGAAAALLGELGPGDALLVKGSRVAGLERLAERLAAP